MNSTIDAIKANLFPLAHSAIEDWTNFPWHRDRHQTIQAYKVESSQALAIDVFGTIKVSPERDRILGALARMCGVPDDGPWTLKLEYTDPTNLLREPRRTQVDAIAFGRTGLLVIECKFTETGGGCSQPERIAAGPHRGLHQCDGTYTAQVNPANSTMARCALTGKGVLYWQHIPELFGLDAEEDYRPCPFKGDHYQWMRNVVLADRLAAARGHKWTVIAAFADGKGFPTAKKVRSGQIGYPSRSGASLITPLSYQLVIQTAKAHSNYPADWDALASWVERKITVVGETRHRASA